MEAKPHLPPSTQRVVVPLWRGEKGTAHRGVPRGGWGGGGGGGGGGGRCEEEEVGMRSETTQVLRSRLIQTDSDANHKSPHDQEGNDSLIASDLTSNILVLHCFRAAKCTVMYNQQSLYLSIHQSIYPSTHPSMNLSIDPTG